MFRLIGGLIKLIGTISTLMVALDQIKRVVRNQRRDREMDRAQEESSRRAA